MFLNVLHCSEQYAFVIFLFVLIGTSVKFRKAAVDSLRLSVRMEHLSFYGTDLPGI